MHDSMKPSVLAATSKKVLSHTVKRLAQLNIDLCTYMSHGLFVDFF